MPVMSCKKSLTYIVPFKFGRKYTCFYIHLCADVRKCLASLFVCGQLHNGRVCHAMRGCNYVAIVPEQKKITANAVIFVVRPQGLEPWTH